MGSGIILDWVTPPAAEEGLTVLDAGFVYAQGELFRAEVITRPLDKGIKPQDEMTLYQISFCQSWSPGGNEAIERETRPITLRVLVLHKAKRILVQYSLHVPDRRDSMHSLQDDVALGIEPHLGSLARQAMSQAGLSVTDHTAEAQWLRMASDAEFVPSRAVESRGREAKR